MNKLDRGERDSAFYSRTTNHKYSSTNQMKFSHFVKWSKKSSERVYDTVSVGIQ